LNDYIVGVLIDKIKDGNYNLAELLSFFVLTSSKNAQRVLDSQLIDNLNITLDQNGIPIL